MFDHILATFLMMFSIFTGFLMVGYIRPKDFNEEQAIKFDEYTNQILYEYSLLEELDNEPDSNLNENQLDELKDKVLKTTILYINQPIIMYYDNSNKSFSYYSNTDIHYKYLDIVCRQYVLENNCKQIYNTIKQSEIINNPKSEASMKLNELFVQQQKQSMKKMIEKKMNKFIRIGSIHEYEYEKVKPQVDTPKNVSILDFLKFYKKD